MDEYLETLEIFYDQKMNYLENKDKYIKCNDCENDKQFILSSHLLAQSGRVYFPSKISVNDFKHF